jgi:hypothetical protein
MLTPWLRRSVLLYCGILAIVFGRALIRYGWRIVNDIETDMPLTSGMLTSPIIAAVIWACAVVIEAQVSIFDRAERSRYHHFFIGMSYAAVLAFTISRTAGVLTMLFVNPLMCRWVLDYRTR